MGNHGTQEGECDGCGKEGRSGCKVEEICGAVKWLCKGREGGREGEMDGERGKELIEGRGGRIERGREGRRGCKIEELCGGVKWLVLREVKEGRERLREGRVDGEGGKKLIEGEG